MRAKLTFWQDSNGARWLRMELSGEGWTPGWAVGYSYLESWGMLPWFATPPAESEGFQANRDYAMSASHTKQEFDGFIDLLHQLIDATKPEIVPRASFRVEDERDYTS